MEPKQQRLRLQLLLRVLQLQVRIVEIRLPPKEILQTPKQVERVRIKLEKLVVNQLILELGMLETKELQLLQTLVLQVQLVEEILLTILLLQIRLQEAVEMIQRALLETQQMLELQLINRIHPTAKLEILPRGLRLEVLTLTLEQEEPILQPRMDPILRLEKMLPSQLNLLQMETHLYKEETMLLLQLQLERLRKKAEIRQLRSQLLILSLIPLLKQVLILQEEMKQLVE